MRSPYNLVQEWAAERADPVWSVIVACSLLNRTHGRQVRPMVEAFFERFPTPDAVLLATDQELAERLRPLGLYNRRLRTLRHMAAEYSLGAPLTHIPGVGEYALASVKIFVMHDTNVHTDDPWLNKYLDWIRCPPSVPRNGQCLMGFNSGCQKDRDSGRCKLCEGGLP